MARVANETARPRFDRFASHVLPAWGFVLLVFIGGSLHFVPYPHIEPPIPWDKISHFVGFAALYPFALRAERFVHPRRSLINSGIRSLIRVIALGGLLEIYQAALPHRSAELADWAADALGALFGACVVLGTAEWLRRRRVAASVA
jgi:VanZ family protein